MVLVCVGAWVKQGGQKLIGTGRAIPGDLVSRLCEQVIYMPSYPPSMLGNNTRLINKLHSHIHESCSSLSDIQNMVRMVGATCARYWLRW